jgi:hypothetical protein
LSQAQIRQQNKSVSCYSARQKQRDYLCWGYIEMKGDGGLLALRMGNWKGVKTWVQKNPETPWQIYNLETLDAGWVFANEGKMADVR